jgi:hypothetical protein
MTDHTEHNAQLAWLKARNAYNKNACPAAASAVLQAATALCAISDDYQHLLDEADDIMAEP